MEFDFFNGPHLIMLGIFLVIATVFFVLITKFKQSERAKERIFQILAIGTFVIHISVIWWLFITQDGIFVIPFNFIWPLALCNVIAFLNMVISLMNKNSKLFKFMATSCAWLGIFGGILSLLAGKTGAVDYDSVRSLTSHFFMLLTSVYIFIAGYSKIRVSNLISVSVGLVFNGLLGLFSNWVFAIKGWETQNAMWFYDGLLEGVAATKGYFVAIYILVAIFIFTAIYEQVKLKKEDRWYSQLRRTFAKKRK